MSANNIGITECTEAIAFLQQKIKDRTGAKPLPPPPAAHATPMLTTPTTDNSDVLDLSNNETFEEHPDVFYNIGLNMDMLL